MILVVYTYTHTHIHMPRVPKIYVSSDYFWMATSVVIFVFPWMCFASE